MGLGIVLWQWLGRRSWIKNQCHFSVTGFIMYLLGVPICWRSKAQKGVTLSSSKAEYVAMSEAVKEIRFIYYLLRSMFIEVKLPIIVRCDNVGAILMFWSSHPTCWHKVSFCSGAHFDEFIKVVFVKSVENDANLFTKNVSKDAFTKHVSNFLGKMEDSNGWILEIGRVLDCITNILYF